MRQWMRNLVRWLSAWVWREEDRRLAQYDEAVVRLQLQLQQCNKLRSAQLQDYYTLKAQYETQEEVIHKLRLRIVGGCSE